MALTPALTDTLGRPLRDLRISVTDRCNLRCTYCMPAEIFGPNYAFLPRAEILSFEEIERLARIFVGLGVQKLRLTGGEPLLRASLEELVARLSGISSEVDIALTTNGTLLKNKARALKDAGLKRVTVSLDALSDEKFAAVNGGKTTVAAVLEGIEAAASVGLAVKINMVVQKGINDDQLEAMAAFFREQHHILRFIEFMDVGNHNGWNLERVLPSSEIVRRIAEKVGPLEPVSANHSGEVASRYRYTDTSQGAPHGEIGLISSVTAPFCGDCSRMRLSAKGELYTCLFSSVGHDLRTFLRDASSSDTQIINAIKSIWTARVDRYSELRGEQTEDTLEGRKKVEMSHIGG